MHTTRAMRFLVLPLALGGCATLMNPGGVTTGSATAAGSRQDGTVKLAPFEIRHIPADAVLYDNDVRLDASQVRAKARVAPRRMCLEVLDVIERTGGGGANDRVASERQKLMETFRQSFPENCDYSHSPYDMKLLLAQGTEHRMRFVDGAREATVTVKASMHLRWIWFNGFLGPAFPLGLIVDASTKKWTYFNGSFDVAKEMAARRTASN